MQGLFKAGFTVEVLDASGIDPHILPKLTGGTILLDGMLTRLSRLIRAICARHPDIQVVVATDAYSFAVHCEVLHFDGITYIFGPLSDDAFASKIKAGACGRTAAAAVFLKTHNFYDGVSYPVRYSQFMHCDRITNMKTINLAQLGKPNHQWQSWIRGLQEAGFNIRIANPLAMELQEIYARPGDVVLLDGTLPNLHRFIAKACARCPEAHVIVATDFPSSSIYQAVMNYKGVIYFSGPLTADRFTKIVCETTAHDTHHLA